MAQAIAVPCSPPLTTVDFLTVGRTPIEQALLAWLVKFEEPTLAGYKRDIGIFLDWCAQVDLDPLKAKRVHMELYIRYLQTRGWAEATVNSRFCTVASFYKIALRDEYVDKDPCFFVDRPPIDKDAQLRRGMSPLVHGIFMDAAEQMGIMEHALLALLSLQGLRISEACALNVSSVVFHDGYDHVRGIGKGHKPFDEPLSVPAARAVKAAIDDRTGDEPLLLTKWRTRMTRNAAQRIIDRVAASAHLDVDVTPHSFRRAFCTTLLAGGAPPRDVQRGMRHASLRTTEGYDTRPNHPDRHPAHQLGSFIAGVRGGAPRPKQP